MKKNLVFTVLLSFFSCNVFAADILLDVSAGYTAVSMESINTDLQSAYDGLNLDSRPEHQNIPMGGGYYASLAAGFALNKGLYLAAKASYISAFEGKVLGRDTSAPIGHTITYSGTMIPVMAGLVYVANIGSVKVGGEAFAGWGFVSSLGHTLYESSSPDLEYDIKGTGGCFTADIAGKASFALAKWISAGISAGYRLATATKLIALEDTSFLGDSISKGSEITGYQDKPLEMNFSGITIGVDVELFF